MEKNLFSELKEFSGSGLVGFEKESIRIINSKIAQSPHPVSLGSALCNQYITTDFSEAQLELVTPPFQERKKALNFLNDIHHFISCNLEDDILWPFSMPPSINSDKDIPIANYGSSNLGLFKRAYRKGLSHRYGRMMQAISGVHYNYSVPDIIWQSPIFENINISSKGARSTAYLNMLRNVFRFNWLILYLFGASPIVTKNFITKNSQSLTQIDNSTFYLPYATSLRMSDFGYCNARRNKFQISMNSLQEYISDLRKATSTPFNEFLAIDKANTKHEQINGNQLQIDDEYYAAARAKSKIISHQTTTSKLETSGIDFIELRSLDLNPYSRIGIDEETVFFVETLLIYCFTKQSPYFTDQEIRNISHNDSLVAKNGRKPNLCLLNNGKKTSLKEWGQQILDDLLPIAAALDSDKQQYTYAVNNNMKRINDPNLTLSGRFLDDILSKNMSFIDFGNSIGEANKSDFLNTKKTKNNNWELIAKESLASLNQQKILESNETESFEAFIQHYTNY